MNGPEDGVTARDRHPSMRRKSASRFAHPSEEIFANLLSLYGVSWEYEPYEFPLAWDEDGSVTRGFRPDFLLPELSLFIELTVLAQPLVTRKNKKIREFRSLYPEIHLRVIYRRDFLDIAKRHHLLAVGEAA